MNENLALSIGTVNSGILLLMLALNHAFADDPQPAGLSAAIGNPDIPSILDVTILSYTEAGHGEITVNKVYKAGPPTSDEIWSPPKYIRGYGYNGSDKIAPLKAITNPQTKRFLVFLDKDLLYSTYNNRFPIREDARGTLEVGTGFNGSGGPWVAMSDVAKRIPAKPDFARKYVQDAELTEAEEQLAIQLAKQCGVSNIAKISTYYLHPSNAKGILVEGVEEIAGRHVSYQTLRINYKKWHVQDAGPRENETQLGGFWAGKPQTRKQTILKIGKKEYRTSSITGFSIEQCETILGKFQSGDYTLVRGTRSSLEQVDWTKPIGFFKHGKTTSVSFPHKREGNGFFDVEIQMVEPNLIVKQVVQAVP